MKKQHTLWVEKYRSPTLEDYVGNESIKDFIQECIAKNDIPHMIFSGPPGTGKTTLAKIIVNSIDCDYLYINATDERSMDVMRDKVKGFASSASFKSLKVVILDEADFIRIDSQALLRNVIETFSLNTRFILTCNYVERIIDPIQSRCQVLNIIPPSKKDIATHMAIILDKEEIEYEAQDLVKVVNKFYPDLRKTLGTCQILSKDSKLVIDDNILVSGSYKELILKELKQPSSKSFNNIRQIIADSQVGEFEEVYKFLFEHIDEYAQNNIGEVIVLLEEYMFHANFKVDKEINMLALIHRILSLSL
jgi:replication factor C small subunit